VEAHHPFIGVESHAIDLFRELFGEGGLAGAEVAVN
jgi:hypothetical protein